MLKECHGECGNSKVKDHHTSFKMWFGAFHGVLPAHCWLFLVVIRYKEEEILSTIFKHCELVNNLTDTFFSVLSTSQFFYYIIKILQTIYPVLFIYMPSFAFVFLSRVFKFKLIYSISLMPTGNAMEGIYWRRMANDSKCQPVIIPNPCDSQHSIIKIILQL